MVFFKGDKKKRAWDAASETLAESLLQSLTSAGLLILQKPRKGIWERLIAKLRHDYGNSQAEQTIGWLCQNAGGQFTPRVRAPRDLEDKFEQIIRAMEASGTSLSVVVEPTNQMLAVSLGSDLPFPVEIAAILPNVLQRTQDNWLKVRRLLESLVFEERDQKFVNHILERYSPTFKVDWLLFLSRRFGHLNHYHGPATATAFEPSHVWFRESFWQDWSRNWCGRADKFDGILQILIRSYGK